MLRATALSHLADAYATRLNDVVDTLCLQNGKLRYEASFEANFIIRGLRFAAGLAVQNFGRVVDPRPGLRSMSIRQPVGVAGLIIPWNSPAYLCIRALAPALAAGCTTVVKCPRRLRQWRVDQSHEVAHGPFSAAANGAAPRLSREVEQRRAATGVLARAARRWIAADSGSRIATGTSSKGGHRCSSGSLGLLKNGGRYRIGDW